MADQYFHLTIGPVQAFVAQARRTRDFWAGSFILSYLSSVAMAAVRQQQGEIEFPIPDQNFLNWLSNKDKDLRHRPQQGSVPNRFKAMEVRVSAGFDPHAVVNAVQLVWKKIAEQVWEKDIAPIVGDSSVQREIWNRQINNFWEISWCLTEQRSLSNLLDRRKNWRSHIVADEPGVKCSLMEGYQELSGAEKPGQAVSEFWHKVRQQGTYDIARDIRADEHLCAIALVKRRFVHYFKALRVELPAVAANQGLTIHGWALSSTVPSIAYMAATPWLAASIFKAADDFDVNILIAQLESHLKRLNAPWEGVESLHILKACAEVDYHDGNWRQVDGQYLFLPALQQMIKEADKDPTLQTDVELLKQIETDLKVLRQKTGLGDPSPFYAVLLMDGDSLGVQMSDAGKQKGISDGLNRFTAGVPELVRLHSGFLVYAGGDDVLAILPQPFALDCALAIRQHYEQCFAEVNQNQGEAQIFTSISAAINFAHYKTPLSYILQDSHQLLDEVAKDQSGRNSLAVRLHKPGGLNAEWFTPWRYVPAMQLISRQVADSLKGDLSHAFFFKLEEIISALNLTDEAHGFDEKAIRALVRAAWTQTGKKLDSLPKEMDLNLLEACRVVKRRVEGEQELFEDTKVQFAPGALRLIHFLATENQRFLREATVSEEVDA
ncbi:hypothetical protein AAEX37_02020 [Oligella sp. MSHR50489EDL]|uniref:type III-B CRISPR-associated protein Cas10/Cmr2 n=1 Tax=Oligella sp. MSHR50489EDL TaxID=3139409 RepID=UPI003D812C98